MQQPTPYRTIEVCRSCGHKVLTPILSLGNLSVSNFVDAGSSDAAEGYPLDLVLCSEEGGGCGLLQLKHTVSPATLYRNYWYRSGVNATMIAALADIVKQAESIVSLKENDIVLDIGCNDGVLLRSYGRADIRRVGFEPALNMASLAKEGTTKIFSDFFNGSMFQETYGEEKAKVVTAIAMFYDLDDPVAFVTQVQNILARDGVFIIQMAYLPTMLETNNFDNICHEHLEYYSLRSLEHLLNRCGLETFDVELNDVNGCSIRTYIRHKGSSVGSDRGGATERVAALFKKEDALGLTKGPIYDAFADRVMKLKNDLHSFIKDEAGKGKKTYVYGASTKGNTLLQFFDLDESLIPAAADRNPIKWGKRTIATNIPIISEEQARNEKPDYFLVLPWHFLKEFINREQDFLKRGGKFIVPMPEFKVIGAEAISG